MNSFNLQRTNLELAKVANEIKKVREELKSLSKEGEVLDKIFLNGSKGLTESMEKSITNIYNVESSLKNLGKVLEITFSSSTISNIKIPILDIIGAMKDSTSAAFTWASDLSGQISKVTDAYKEIVDSSYTTIESIEDIDSKTSDSFSKTTNSISSITEIAGTISPAIEIASSAVSAILGIAEIGYKTFNAKSIEYRQKTQKELSELSREIESHQQAWENTKQETRFNIFESEGEIDGIKILWEELQKLVDINGKVKKGNTERVNFIIGQLNSALGTQLSLENDLVKNYQEESNNIDTLIEKKRAELLLSAYEEEYNEAIRTRNKLQEEQITLSQKMYEQQAIVDSTTSSAIEKANARNALDEYGKQYQEAASVISSANRTIARVEKASEEATLGHYDKVKDILEGYELTYTAAGNATKEQLAQQSAYATNMYIQMAKRMKEGDASVTAEMLVQINDFAVLARKEYEKAGGAANEGFIIGFDQEGNPIIKTAEELGMLDSEFGEIADKYGSQFAIGTSESANRTFEDNPIAGPCIENFGAEKATSDLYGQTQSFFEEVPFTGAKIDDIDYQGSVLSSVEGASTMLGENPLTMHTGSVTYGEAVSGAVTNANTYFGTNKLTMQTGNVSFFGAVANALFGANSQMAGSPLYGMNVGMVSYALPVSSALIGANTMLSISPLSSMWVNKISYASPLSTMLTDIKNYLRWNPLQIFGKFAGWAPGGSVYYAANGGMIESPQITVVGEAGPESIIPLSKSRRSRALELYTQTSEALGVDEQIARAAVMSSVSGSRAAMAFLAAEAVTPEESRVEINYRKLAQELYGALSASPIEVRPSFTVTGGDVYLDTVKAGKALAPHIDAELGKINHRRERGL